MEEKSTVEYECPVCTLLMAKPCSFKCNHTFCIQCALQMKEYMQRVKCPLCRCRIDKEFEVDRKLQDKIKEQHPKKYEARIKQLEELKKLEGDKMKIELVFGNRYRNLETLADIQKAVGNRHEWTMFVKAKDKTIDLNKFIRKVSYDLHPTFHPRVVDREKAPYQLKRCGWGTFTVDIKIHFFKKYNKPPLELEHYLVFEGEGRWRSRTISIKKIE